MFLQTAIWILLNICPIVMQSRHTVNRVTILGVLVFLSKHHESQSQEGLCIRRAYSRQGKKWRYGITLREGALDQFYMLKCC